ncbi:MAG: hypothetical protein U1E70_10535 [Acetobacteraceae bacterium]|nr:hypothetical protein [Pseudomonadota bacterium]
MPEQTAETARGVAARLQARGHADHAARLHAAIASAEVNLLMAVREACQTILTAIEAVDPVSATMVDELRLAVDRRLDSAA